MPYSKKAQRSIELSARLYKGQKLEANLPSVRDFLGRETKDLTYEDQVQAIDREISRRYHEEYLPTWNKLFPGIDIDDSDCDSGKAVFRVKKDNLYLVDQLSIYNILETQQWFLKNHLSCTPARNTIVKFMAKKRLKTK